MVQTKVLLLNNGTLEITLIAPSRINTGLPTKDETVKTNCDDPTVKLCLLHLRVSDIMACLMIWQRNIQVAGNHECKETDSINSVQSSLKSDALWVIMFIVLKKPDAMIKSMIL